MKEKLFILITLFLIGCSSVPITSRTQLNVIPENQLISSSSLAYQSFLNENAVISSNNQDAQMVKKVGQKLAKACHDYLADKGDISRLEGFDWEFNLVNSPEINAWCMPGGKVVVYQGILPITQNEEGLAVVLSHEIAHAVARHGNERVSQQMVSEYGSVAVSALFANTSDSVANIEAIVSKVYGTGSQLGLLKFSRLHETEADKMGLVFMEYAGYDSNNAIEFWKRMSANGGQKPPEFLSTHPSDERRINDITTFIPIAKSYKN
ncbi:MAG: M48 family metallopeptidase [Salibacteraceae bacterium]